MKQRPARGLDVLQHQALAWAFFKSLIGRTMHRPLQIFQKKYHVACSNPKQGPSLLHLKSHFQPKTPRKHSKNLVKPIYGNQKANKPSQTLKITQNKNSSRVQICCFRCYQGNNT